VFALATRHWAVHGGHQRVHAVFATHLAEAVLATHRSEGLGTLFDGEVTVFTYDKNHEIEKFHRYSSAKRHNEAIELKKNMNILTQVTNQTYQGKVPNTILQ